MGESNTVVSAYTMYWHLRQYCSYSSKFQLVNDISSVSLTETPDRIAEGAEQDEIERMCRQVLLYILRKFNP